MPKIHISKFVKLILCCIYLFYYYYFFNVNNRPKDRLTNQNAAFGNKCICSLRYAQRYWTYPGQSDLWHDLFGSSNVAPTLPTRAQTVRLTSWNMYGGLHSALLSGFFSAGSVNELLLQCLALQLRATVVVLLCSQWAVAARQPVLLFLQIQVRVTQLAVVLQSGTRTSVSSCSPMWWSSTMSFKRPSARIQLWIATTET